MGEFRLIGLFAIIPTTMLLAVSFFVLFTARKAEQQELKIFGIVIAVLLWISAALVFSSGFYTIATGRCPVMKMHKMMMHKMCYPQEEGQMQKPMQRPMMEHKR